MKPKVVAFTAFVALPIASFATFFLVDAVAGPNQPPAAVATVSSSSPAAANPAVTCAMTGGEQGACNHATAAAPAANANAATAQPVAKLMNGACPYMPAKNSPEAASSAAMCPTKTAKSAPAATTTPATASGCCAAAATTATAPAAAVPSP